MADQLPAQTRKRDHESDIDEPIQKVQRADEQDVVQAKTIDCLERIFDFLDLESLLNVAGTCKRLQTAAAAKFGDDFVKNIVWIDCCGSTRKPFYKIHQNLIRIRSLKFCFPFLRCFGAKIRDLTIDGNKDHVDSYINEYCADTLSRISYASKSSFPTQAFQKPFQRVEQVALFQCRLQDQFPNFVDWFPNIQTLTITRCSINTTATATAAHFPHLKGLNVNISPHENSTLELVKNVLQCNQQLQNIRLSVDADLTFCTLLEMLNGNKSIIELGTWVSEGRFEDVTMTHLNQFAVEHPSVVVLNFGNYRFAVEDVINFIQKMNMLKFFQFLVEVEDYDECDRILGQLGTEWQGEASDDFVIKLNRQ